MPNNQRMLQIITTYPFHFIYYLSVMILSNKVCMVTLNISVGSIF